MSPAPKADAGLFKWADFYLSLGFSVVPLREGKIPAVPWKQFQERKASRLELMKWFEGSGWGLALVCGKVSGNLVRIDFDDPADYAELKSKLPIAPTFKSQRKGGGYGMLLRSTLPVPLLPQKTFGGYPKLEIRGEGSITVAPPTPGYEWLGQFASVKEVDVPAMLTRLFGFDLSNRQKLADSVERTAGDELAILLKETGVGERSNNLVRIAGMLRARGIDLETALEVMEHNFDEHWPHDGMTWAEAQDTFERAWKRYEHEGVRLTGRGPTMASRPWEDDEEDDAIVIQHMSEMKKKTEDETVLVANVVCAGELGNTVVAAPTKIGKTSLFVDMCVTASRGDLVWQALKVMRPLRIAYIDQERKVEQILENKDLMAQVIGEPNDDNLIFLSQKSGDFNISHQKTLNRLYAVLEEFGPDLVILDGWAWMCKNPSDNDMVRQALSWMKKMRQELKCASIIIHHFKKAQQYGTTGANSEFSDMLDQMSGMKRLSDQAHTALVYVPINGYDTFNVLSGKTNKPSWDPPKTVIDYDHTSLTHRVVTAEEGLELFDADTYRNLWGVVSSESRRVKGIINMIRNSFGLSQVELAAKIGVDRAQVSRWYSGRQNPSKEAMERLFALYREAKEKPMKAARMPAPRASKGLGDR